MKKQFVTYEIALKLKELGFDEECLAYYDIKMLFPVEQPLPDEFNTTKTNNIYYNNDFHYTSIKLEDDIIIAPLYQQVTDWIREKYGIHIDLDFGLGWGYGFIPVGTELTYNWNHFEDGHKWSYYEARKQAILKAIKLCKKQ